MQKKRNRNFWRNHTILFNKLNITQAQYCRENNLSQNYFSRVLTREKTKAKNNNDFIEIKKETGKIPDQSYVLNIGNKYSVNIPSFFEKSSLEKILNILETRL